MNDSPNSSNPANFTNDKAVYGPVKSWRFGNSLGIDPIFWASTCTFNCIYCQLGKIQNVTMERTEYVGTSKVLSDFKEILNTGCAIDIITHSGCGEPTLAINLGEIIQGIAEIAPTIPQIILTSGATLGLKEVISDLCQLDRVIIKLDAASQKVFKQINRPSPLIDFAGLIENIISFRDSYSGTLEIQTMFIELNAKELEEYAKLLIKIRPDVVHLNTPKRPYPLSWHRENRGNHLGIFDYEVRNLKIIDKSKALEIDTKLKELTSKDLPNLEILSIYSGQ